MRVLVVVTCLVGCKSSEPADKAKPSGSGAPLVVAGSEPPVKTGSSCTSLELELVSKVLADPAHPCRASVEAAYGRVAPVGVAFSGTIVSTAPARGGGLFVTCQHCTGAADSAVFDPETDPPPAFQIRPPATLVDGKVLSPEDKLVFVHRMFAPVPPRSAYVGGGLGKILPKHDLVVGTISGNVIEIVGHIGVIAPPKVDDRDLPIVDPKGIAVTKTPWTTAKPGTHALLLGFPRDLPDKAFGGELVASVGEILTDDAARDLLLRSDADEAAIPYDPSSELVVAAHASSGMSGGGAFDEDGRYLGIAVRATVKPVDGKYLVRVVRAPYVAEQLNAAIAAAPAPLQAKLAPFLP